MAISVRKLPPVLDTWFLEEARSIPTAHIGATDRSIGYLGVKIRRQCGPRITAGWALPVLCPAGDNLASILALQYLYENPGHGKWMIVISQDESGGASDASLWNYMQSVMGWEIGVAGVVVNGYVRDIDEIQEKLGKEFGLYAWGGSPVKPELTPYGSIAVPVTINGVTIRPGDLIVGDNDGVVCIPRDEVESVISICKDGIVDEVNKLQHVREGWGAVDVLELGELLENNVEYEE